MYTHTITRHGGTSFTLMDQLDFSGILDIAEQIDREARDPGNLSFPGSRT